MPQPAPHDLTSARRGSGRLARADRAACLPARAAAGRRPGCRRSHRGRGQRSGRPASWLRRCGAGAAVTDAVGTTDWWSKQRLHHTVNFANWPDYIDVLHGKHPTLEHFTALTGISVNYTEPVSDNVAFFNSIKPSIERKEYTGYDIIVTTTNSPALGELISNNWLIPLDQAMMTNFRKYAGRLAENPPWDPGNTYTMPWQSGWTAIGYNSCRRHDPGTSVGILFDSKYAGKVGMMSDPQELGSVGLLAIGVEPATSTEADWRKAATFLRKQKSDGIVRGYYNQNYIDNLKSGEIVVSQAYSGDIFQANLQQQYRDLQLLMPLEGGMFWTDNMCIPLYAENPKDAMALMDYFYQPQVEAVVEYYNDYVCPVPGAQQELLNPSGWAAATLAAMRPEIGEPPSYTADSPLVFPTRSIRPGRGPTISSGRGRAGVVEQPVPAHRGKCMTDPHAAGAQVPRAQVQRARAGALAGARPMSYWLDQPDAPAPLAPLAGRAAAELVVVGGGFTGLWTALQAKEAEPGRDVLLLEGRRVAWAGSGRNGGFCAASLTHGLSNGQDRFPDELATLERLGRRNLDDIEKAVARYGIDCDFARTGELSVATQRWQLDGLRQTAAIAGRLGSDVRLLDRSAVRAEVRSPTYLGGLWDPAGCATLDPARLAWGLRHACLNAGVRIYEDSPVRSLAAEPGGAGRALRLRHLAATSPRAASPWPPAPSRRCYAGCGTT